MVAGVGARSQAAPKSLSATATFILSEEGRKASLLSGGDGRALQTVTLEVPASRLHLVSVDRQGVARLRLRPRFEVDANQRVTRLDSFPAFDTPPSADELLRLAARNHELEQTYRSARTTAALTRQDAQRELRERVAQAFIADPAQRAMSHPPPTQRRCCIEAEGRRIVFDVTEDPVLAKTVALEATRRFRADQRAKREQTSRSGRRNSRCTRRRSGSSRRGSRSMAPLSSGPDNPLAYFPWKKRSPRSLTKCSQRPGIILSTRVTAPAGFRNYFGEFQDTRKQSSPP